MKTTISYFLSLILVACLISCHQDSNTLLESEIILEPQELEETNFNGIVTDIHGLALENAMVEIGNNTALTDANGFFILTSTVNSKGAKLTVRKDGFFNGLGNLSLNSEKDNFVKIVLQERVIIETLQSDIGGVVNYLEHQVSFQTNSFMLESGDTYDGDVEVYITYIDPTSPNFSFLMPGDLLVESSSQQGQILKSYGMLHVELSTPQGDPLQINKPATLKMAIPDGLKANAPNQIPLWFFDEEKALWIEEGVANKEGNNYVGSVSHFSLWNCDDPFDFINLNGTFLARSTFKNTTVRVTSELMNETKIIETNDRGQFAGKVPANDNLLIELEDNCGTIAFSESIETFNTDIDRQFAVDVNDYNLITLRGYLSDCDGNPVSNGYVILNNGSHGSVIYQCDIDGYIETDFYKCSDEDITVTVVDLNNNLQSSATFSLTSNELNIGNLEACGDEVVSKIVFYHNDEVTTQYLVTLDESSPTLYSFYQSVQFSNGSSYTVEHKLQFDVFVDDIWEVRSTFTDIIGTPDFAFAFKIDDHVNFIEETDEYIEVEFPIVRIFDYVKDEYLTEEGKVYIKALK